MTFIKKHTALIFIVSLAVLLFNDFYLKERFHNVFSGKLSDFVGLFIFPWFWSLIFRKWAKTIYVITAVFFVFWKLEIASGVLDLVNGFFKTQFYRVTDSSDLIAISVLPLSFKLMEVSWFQVNKLADSLKWSISIIAIFSFFATSQPRLFVSPKWEFNEEYQLPFGKDELLSNQMIYRPGGLPDVLVLSESTFSADYNGGVYTFNFDFRIEGIDSTKSRFTLTGLNSYVIKGTQSKKDKLDKSEFLEIFESEVVDYLSLPVQTPSLVYFYPNSNY